VYFKALESKHWMNISGRPLIYFYNAGKLKPQSGVAPVVAAMKKLFLRDFGVEPFVVLDSAFPSGNTGAADADFKWYF
jgi:hypothetical protein